MQLLNKPNQEEIIYPSSDGEPMADSTLQYQWITIIKGGCDAIFKDNPDVFVAGDLLWYPVQGKPNICQAPDTMIVFGRPKGERTSYLQWLENNLAPQVVFEIQSHSDSVRKMSNKLIFYTRYGVEEYYLYDPQKQELSGWLRNGEYLEDIEAMENWISPRLGIRFFLGENGLELYAPNGEKLVDYVDLYRQKELAEERAKLAEEKARILAEKLRELGFDPEMNL